MQDAKARFSELLEACLSEGPQIVTRRGQEAAVVVAMDEWRRLDQGALRSIKSLLLAPKGRAELILPERGRARRRRRPAL